MSFLAKTQIKHPDILLLRSDVLMLDTISVHLIGVVIILHKSHIKQLQFW